MMQIKDACDYFYLMEDRISLSWVYKDVVGNWLSFLSSSSSSSFIFPRIPISLSIQLFLAVRSLELLIQAKLTCLHTPSISIFF